MRGAEVLVVVYDGVQLLDVAGPVEAFDGASRVVPGAYRVRLGSLGGRDVAASSGVRLSTADDLAGVAGGLDTLLVAGGVGYAGAAADAALVEQVRRLSALARRTVSVCTGAFVLAEAGLLDGRRATTHWAYCAELAGRRPAVRVEPDAIFVRDGAVGTSAGVTAGLDLALALVEEDHGPRVARLVAQWLVAFLQRPGGQAQFGAVPDRGPGPGLAPAPEPGDGALRRLLGEIAADPGGDHSVPALARRLSVSERHVSRIFARHVGTTPGRYVERARVAAARALLESGADGVRRIARRCGFGTAESMRRAFIREIGVPPSAYRDRFTATRS